MADTDDGNGQPTAAPPPQAARQPQDLHGQWTDWLGDADNRAAMISFGASMLQPSWYGTASKIGQSVGAAGETMDARRKAALEEEKQLSSEGIAERNVAAREREAAAYEARSGEDTGDEEKPMTLNQRVAAHRALTKEYEARKNDSYKPETRPFMEWLDAERPGQREAVGISPSGGLTLGPRGKTSAAPAGPRHALTEADRRWALDPNAKGKFPGWERQFEGRFGPGTLQRIRDEATKLK